METLLSEGAANYLLHRIKIYQIAKLRNKMMIQIWSLWKNNDKYFQYQAKEIPGNSKRASVTLISTKDLHRIGSVI